MVLDFYQLEAISEKLTKRFGEKVMVCLIANLSIENLINLVNDL